MAGRIPLTLVRASSSADVPHASGQVILRPDTGVMEADLDSGRIRLAGVEGVDELPEHPLDRVYLNRGQFWAHDGTKWVRLGGRSVCTLTGWTERVEVSASNGDFQMLRLSRDTEIVPPADIAAYGQEVLVEVTDARAHSFTIARETYGGTACPAGDADAWLVTFHKGLGGVVRWRAEPLHPDTRLYT